VGLKQFTPIDSMNVMKDLNQFQKQNSELYETAATLIKNGNSILPIQNLADIKIAYVPLEESDYDKFYQNLNFHVPTDLVKINSVNQISKLKDYDLVIIGLHKSHQSVYKRYKFSETSSEIVKTISVQNPT